MHGKVQRRNETGDHNGDHGYAGGNQNIPVFGKRFDIPAPDRSINIVYYEAPKKNAPLILGFHRGGYAFGGNAMNDAMWSAVAEQIEMNVASVDYRKYPD